MAKSQDANSSKSGMIALLVPAIVAIGGGAGLGLYLGGLLQKNDAPATEQHAKAPPVEADAAHGAHKDAHGEASGHEKKATEEQGKLTLKALPAIVANLASPPKALIRIQAAILYDAAKLPHPDVFMAEFSSDVVAFLKTLPMSSIEGADGLRDLSENLTDRAAIRSNQAVHELVIESMVIQ